MKKVSIIVPVYNAEKYLRKCVDSLVNQTLEDIEIILVSDASPDGSNDIMREYEAEYPGKIRCIYLEKNVRQGGARNRGIDIATGEFITFVDSDDYVDITMCEKLYKKAKESDSDLVFCDYYRDLVEQKIRKYRSFVCDELVGELDDVKRKALLFGKNMPFAKLIKTEMIKENKILFPENMVYEDVATVMIYYLYADRIDWVKEALYYWYIREDSTSHAMNVERQFDIAKAGCVLLEQFKVRRFYDRYKDEVDAIFTIHFYLNALKKAVDYFDNVPLKKLQYLRDTMRNTLPNYKENPYYLLYGDINLYEYADLNDESPEKFKELVDSKQLNSKDFSYRRVYEKVYDYNRNLLQECKVRKYRVALWGAGKRGREFLSITDRNGQLIDCVFDNNKKLHGTCLEAGHEVCDFLSEYQNIDVILCTNKNYVCDIQRLVTEYEADIRVIDLDLYMRSKMPL